MTAETCNHNGLTSRSTSAITSRGAPLSFCLHSSKKKKKKKRPIFFSVVENSVHIRIGICITYIRVCVRARALFVRMGKSYQGQKSKTYNGGKKVETRVYAARMTKVNRRFD